MASKLGILSTSSPILITSFKPVPPGTIERRDVYPRNRCVPDWRICYGTLAIMLAIENTTCTQSWMTELVPLLFWGAAAGGIGSLVGFYTPTSSFYDLMDPGRTTRLIRSSEPPYKRPASHPRPNAYNLMKSDQPPRRSRL